MNILRSVSAWRVVTLLLMTPLVCISGACEKQGEDTGPAGDTPTSVSFTLPEVDVSGLPEGLQNRLRTLREEIERSSESADKLGALGTIYFVHDFPEAAAACFARAKELAPRTMHWWYYTGLAREHAGLREKATETYERALELDANYGPLYVRLAGLLVESDRDRASRLCRRALELNPKDPTAIFTLGLCDEAAGDQDAALKRFEEALQLAPGYKEAHEATARILAASGRADQAETHRAAALKGTRPLVDDHLFGLLLRNGFHLETLLRDSLILAERGLFEEADKALAKAREVDRAGNRTHRATALVRAMEGRFDEAEAEFRRVLDDKPDMVAVRGELADVLARHEKYPEAEAEFRRVLEKDPDNALALERFSRLLMVLERSDEAETLLREAAQRRPEAAWIRFQLGSMFYNVNKDDEARAQLLKCLEILPEHIRARYFLGLVADRGGDKAEAIKQWEQVVEKTPGFLDAHVALAQTAIQEHDFTTAERYLRNGLKQDPDLAGLTNGLAWILATSPDDDQRNGEEALRLAQKACKLTQNKRHACVDTLAAAYAELGRFDEAVKTVRDAIKLAQDAGDNETVEEYQQRLTLFEKQQPFRDTE